MTTPDRPWVLVANAAAGGNDDEIVDAVVALLRPEIDVVLHRTSSPEELEPVVKEAVGGTVLVLGGDGSIHAVVSALDRFDLLEDVAVAVVPLGTGNDFVRTIGMAEDTMEAAGQVLSCTERRADLVRDQDGEIVINAVHVGLGVHANVAAEPWKKALGPVGYAIGTIVAGVTGRGVDAVVEIDGQRVKSPRRLLQVAVGNGKYVGGGAPLLPDADPFDGLLDVAVSWSTPRWHRLGYAWRLRRGRHPMRDDVVYRQATTVTVRGESMAANLDGDIGEPGRTHTWTVQPGRLRLLVP
ncbi:hypothetical protein ASD11_00270 [Aeromicrobium sp. Root495]|uniref:diacylglycerol/lipid kinase family protein n=1 Tax=Aeromicrobium sp. Root495 TaxID=1736550 RepID=UPI0006F27DE2|nr:diacylglycerol kinase family protein [Aeromicrobium sp. Root495]KQY58145.1 hypothetical protein ASD11_00270 [Aeromicrobium sp. Root495]